MRSPHPVTGSHTALPRSRLRAAARCAMPARVVLARAKPRRVTPAPWPPQPWPGPWKSPARTAARRPGSPAARPRAAHRPGGHAAETGTRSRSGAFPTGAAGELRVGAEMEVQPRGSPFVICGHPRPAPDAPARRPAHPCPLSLTPPLLSRSRLANPASPSARRNRHAPPPRQVPALGAGGGLKKNPCPPTRFGLTILSPRGHWLPGVLKVMKRGVRELAHRPPGNLPR